MTTYLFFKKKGKVVNPHEINKKQTDTSVQATKSPLTDLSETRKVEGGEQGEGGKAAVRASEKRLHPPLVEIYSNGQRSGRSPLYTMSGCTHENEPLTYTYTGVPLISRQKA